MNVDLVSLCQSQLIFRSWWNYLFAFDLGLGLVSTLAVSFLKDVVLLFPSTCFFSAVRLVCCIVWKHDIVSARSCQKPRETKGNQINKRRKCCKYRELVSPTCQKPRETKGDQKGNHEKRGRNRKHTFRQGVLEATFCCYLRRFRTKPFKNSGRPKGDHEKTEKTRVVSQVPLWGV